MTTFQDGPAKGRTLMLKRAPIFLRVVVDARGKWDALDQVDDEPAADEKLYAYQLAENPGHCHINAGRGRGGFYPMARYCLISPQPAESEMRTTLAWIKWVEDHKHTAIVKP